jgi:hypothetical protein
MKIEDELAGRKTIDHDETEFADKRAGWPSTWFIVALIVGLNLYLFPFDWRSAAMGGLVGLMLAAWAIDVTGGKVPESWRRRPPGSGR